MACAAELFVRCLENEGVEYVFGIPGEETLDLNEALDRSGSIQFVPVRHEQGAAFMADAYGRLTGRAGVCLGTLGPGATNLVTGIADAYLDRAPVVALTGQTGLDEMHKESHQYIDVVRMMKPVTKWNARIHDPDIIPEAVRKAFAVAEREKPGATHLELPDDVMEADAEGAPVRRRPSPQIEPIAAELHRAAELLQTCERPVILAGNGVVRQQAAPALRRFCEQTGLNVITTFMGKGVVDADDPHSLFTAGLRAQDYPRGFMGRADLVVCVGYDLVEWSPVAWNPRGDRHIICIDTVAAEVDQYYVPEVELTGDIGNILTHLGNLVSAKPPARLAAPPYQELLRAALEQGSDDAFPVKPQRVLRDLRELMAPEDVLISDVGAHKLWVSRLWPTKLPNTVLISNGAAAMGFAVPAAVAARLVLPEHRRVVTISGDGGVLMNFQELETARRLGLAFVNIVWTDNAFGVIELHQTRKFGRIAGTKFTNPDWVSLAESFGIAGLRVEAAEDVTPMLARALDLDVPSVVEIPIDYRENVRFSERLADLRRVEEGVA
ncbi:MAG TPA: acetolactate synthase large subunit [Gaiellales bacterium]|jgi:acetolactate synthase-1/2/3 large subunit|nr:acetolactate synthase large subunit [Gaiellales bacterium]